MRIPDVSSPVSYWLPNWRTFTWVMALVSLPLVAIFAVCPQSPKWLHQRGLIDESIKVLDHFAAKTGVILPDEFKNTLKIETNSKSQVEPHGKSSWNDIPIVRVFRNSYYRIVALVMGYTFIATTVLYYGISYNAAALPGNLYINNTINGVVEGIF